MTSIDLPLQGSDGVLRLVPWAGQDVREGGRYLYRLLAAIVHEKSSPVSVRPVGRLVMGLPVI
jgi:hypothetical protein